MRRLVPFAVAMVLLASAYPLLRGQDEPSRATSNPAGQMWEYEIYPVGGAGKNREMLKTFNDLGRKGWEYAGLIHDGRTYLFKRPAR